MLKHCKRTNISLAISVCYTNMSIGWKPINPKIRNRCGALFPDGSEASQITGVLGTCHLCRKFTRLPHLAGTQQNLKYAEQIQKEWLEFGLDSVEMVPYDILLSYPNKSQPNYISVVDRHGSEVNICREIF